MAEPDAVKKPRKKPSTGLATFALFFGLFVIAAGVFLIYSVASIGPRGYFTMTHEDKRSTIKVLVLATLFLGLVPAGLGLYKLRSGRSKR